MSNENSQQSSSSGGSNPPDDSGTSITRGVVSSEESANWQRVFRKNIVATKADLRLIVAGAMSHTVAGNETQRLKQKNLHVRSSINLIRGGNRTRHVEGKYTCHIGTSYNLKADTRIEERVDGLTEIDMSKGQDVIIAGPYINTIAGGALKICAWADFLCWGGWLEVDGPRVEIAVAMIRSHWGYVHITGTRVSTILRLVDDYTTRNETWGTLKMDSTMAMNAFAPGGGQLLES